MKEDHKAGIDIKAIDDNLFAGLAVSLTNYDIFFPEGGEPGEFSSDFLDLDNSSLNNKGELKPRDKKGMRNDFLD